MKDRSIKITLATMSLDDLTHWELVVGNLAVADDSRFRTLWQAFIRPLGHDMECETFKRLATLKAN